MVSQRNSFACTIDDAKITRAFPSEALEAPERSAGKRRLVKYHGPERSEKKDGETEVYVQASADKETHQEHS